MKDSTVPERQGGDGPPAKPGLADRVYHLLYSRISNGDYPANRKLPSETTLAEEFGVSRPVLRTALERLREQGLIHSRQGAGSYVREVKTVPLGFARVETIADIQRCYEFRICIETMAARSRTKLPAPCRETMMPSPLRRPRADRRIGRETPNIAARPCSGGSRVLGRNSPLAMRAASCS
jgi:DNA-binding transcriptional regulator YhcF (GntR family)